MGLQNQLTDISSESIPILLISLFANALTYLRYLLFTFFPFSYSSPTFPNDSTVGSGLSGVILLAEHLNLNRLLSYHHENTGSGCCVVCLNRFGNGDRVLKLACCTHVFHTECLDGWFNTLNFSCPLCRSSLVSEERVVNTQRRVAGDLITWFSLT